MKQRGPQIQLISFYKLSMNSVRTIVAAISLLAIGASVLAQSVSFEIPVCTFSGYHLRPQITSNGSGGAFIVWLDERFHQHDVYIQMIDCEGNSYWDTDGIMICEETVRPFPVIISDDTNGAIVVWPDDRDGNWKLFGQRISYSGDCIWNPAGIPLLGGLEWIAPLMNIIPDGTGGGIIAFMDSDRLLMQRFNAQGTMLWSSDGIEVSSDVDLAIPPRLMLDGGGGAIVVWGGGYSSGQNECYAQKLDPFGNIQWASDGVVVGLAGNYDIYPSITSDGTGGAYVVWRGGEAEEERVIVVQKIDGNGNHVWSPEGIHIEEQLCSLDITSAYSAAIIGDCLGGAIVAWHRCVSGVYSAYCQRLDADGKSLWQQGGVLLTDLMGWKGDIQMQPDGLGGAVITWTEWSDETGLYEINSQHVDTYGNIQWSESGLMICAEEGSQDQPQLLVNQSDNAFVTWEDRRYFDNDNINIYAKVVDLEPFPISVLLQNYSVEVQQHLVLLKWSMSEIDGDEKFRIFRCMKSGTKSETLIELVNPAINKIESSYIVKYFPDEYEMDFSFQVEYWSNDKWQVLFKTDLITIPRIKTQLYQNHPNPFNPSTTIKYYLSENSYVSLEIFDVSGKRVATLVNESQDKGQYSLEWNGQDQNWDPVSSGIYIYRLKAGKISISKKMVLLR